MLDLIIGVWYATSLLMPIKSSSDAATREEVKIWQNDLTQERNELSGSLGKESLSNVLSLDLSEPDKLKQVAKLIYDYVDRSERCKEVTNQIVIKTRQGDYPKVVVYINKIADELNVNFSQIEGDNNTVVQTIQNNSIEIEELTNQRKQLNANTEDNGAEKESEQGERKKEWGNELGDAENGNLTQNVAHPSEQEPLDKLEGNNELPLGESATEDDAAETESEQESLDKSNDDLKALEELLLFFSAGTKSEQESLDKSNDEVEENDASKIPLPELLPKNSAGVSIGSDVDINDEVRFNLFEDTYKPNDQEPSVNFVPLSEATNNPQPVSLEESYTDKDSGALFPRTEKDKVKQPEYDERWIRT
ncbi:MAG: hypothetical protein F6J86_27180 [Symploca sp. SIO1B1]|nr:hypothetical protein [Symploca sp. SIO1C2]NER97489.1 hypothetical protein [Symploca sp. SIO1B1]